ncbi:hypothetical protein [Kitasatospora sp. NPDC059817]|uniref:hypothetical protein n=1 Tax=Kitasatospora sp. NPDC059817 TaxID=3346961 RepID=UPI0036488D9D
MVRPALGGAPPAARRLNRTRIRPDLDPAAVADLVFDCYVTALSRWLAGDAAFPLADGLLARLAVLAAGFGPPRDA